MSDVLETVSYHLDSQDVVFSVFIFYICEAYDRPEESSLWRYGWMNVISYFVIAAFLQEKCEISLK